MKKLKASALVYVLVISLIGGIITSCFLLQFELSLKERDFYLRNYKLESYAQSGINYVMAAGEALEDDQELLVEMNIPTEDKISVKKKNWGIYSVALCKASVGTHTLNKAVLLGAENPNDHTGLYVTDRKQAISICGNTRLSGDCYLPENGLKRAYIEGQNYENDQLMYGKQHKSKKEIPSTEQQFISKGLDYLQGKFSASDSLLNFDELISDTIVNSFFNKTVVLIANHSITLQSGFYSGNIVIYSSDKIKIENGAQLKNIILYAKEIEIEQNNQSCLQAFSEHSVVLKKESQLLYPSVLAILSLGNETINEENENLKQEVILEEKTKFCGTVLAVRKFYHPKTDLLVSIGKNAILNGEVYTNDKAEIQGEIKGSVYCNTLYLKTSSSVYENYLLNAKIQGELKPFGFCGIQFTGGNYRKTCIDDLE